MSLSHNSQFASLNLEFWRINQVSDPEIQPENFQ